MIKSYKDWDKELYFCCVKNDFSEGLGEKFIPGKVVIVFPDSGEAKVMVNDKIYNLTPSKMLFMHPHSVVSLQSRSEDFSCRIIALTPAVQETAFMQIEFSFFGSILRQPCWTLDADMNTLAHSFYTMFDHICNMHQTATRTDLISDLFLLFLRLFYEYTKPAIQNERPSSPVANRSLVSRFFHLLRLNFRAEHRVIFYADHLCVTPKYLAQVVKNTVGVTPKDIIDRSLAMEALNLLRHTDKPIQEISDILGFFDQSYFGRFFKRIFEMSPMQFRANPNMDALRQLDDLLDAKYPNLKVVWKNTKVE